MLGTIHRHYEEINDDEEQDNMTEPIESDDTIEPIEIPDPLKIR